jgi:hypothetical protein
MENKSDERWRPYIDYLSYLGNGLGRTDFGVCIPTACLPYKENVIEINDNEEIITKEKDPKHVEENSKNIQNIKEEI